MRTGNASIFPSEIHVKIQTGNLCVIVSMFGVTSHCELDVTDKDFTAGSLTFLTGITVILKMS